jgi:hypothetical protein
MAPSVMAPTRSGSSLCALIASFPTRNGIDPEVIPTLSMYPTNQQSNPIHRTNRLNSGLDTQFADEGLSLMRAVVCFAEVQIVDPTAHPNFLISTGQSTTCFDLGKDYWDMGSMTAQAPPTWLEDFATADNSWLFDATGLT